MEEPRYQRSLNLAPFIAHRSVLLLGPRQTGKSTLLRTRYPDVHYVDLLENESFRALSREPSVLGEQVGDGDLCIVDEVQKLPDLLDEVQRLIDQRGIRFILTGSSARKLHRGQANLLGGRALFFSLYPLTSQEIGYHRIPDLLQLGGLPGVVDSPIAHEVLKAYAGSYLREEVQAEGLTRSIASFSRFLDVAAHFNAEQVNYTKIGNDAQVPPRTIKDYVQILEDTLILHRLQPFRTTRGRKTAATEKVYFFDVGVANALSRRTHVQPGTTEFGKAVEQLIFLELKAAIEYQRLDSTLSFWRTRTNIEVDFLVDDRIAIEVKGKGRVAPADLKSLRALGEELHLARRIVVSLDPRVRTTDDGIEILPIKNFCEALWQGDLLK